MTAHSSHDAAHMAHVDTLLAERAYHGALALLTPMLDTPPPRLEVMDRMAVCYWQLGDAARAVQTMSLIVKLWPDHARSWTKLGSMSVGLGDKDSALGFYDKALSVQPGFLAALVERNQLVPFSPDGKEARALRKVGLDRKRNAKDRAKALHAVGLIEANAGKVARAMHFFGKSKALTPGKYKPGSIEALVEGQKTEFPGLPEAAPLVSARRPVFVTGMPRSGTTLLETMLTRHSAVETVGESSALEQVLIKERLRVMQTHGATGLWDWVHHLDAGRCAELQEAYWVMSAAPKTGVIVDKMPLNALHAGFAALVFPEARFVHMSRHPLDVGLSNFRTHFEVETGFAKRLDWLGHLCRAVHESALDYEEKLGARFRVQSFRALVSAPEPALRGILGHLGLSFEAACLAPEESVGVVTTASRAQVRDGINTRGVGRWRAYETELGPLVDALGGPNWVEAWAAQDSRRAQDLAGDADTTHAA